ncbi:MAG: hypothetical protein ACRDE8_00325, partial [Ginsengibacter sp.]
MPVLVSIPPHYLEGFKKIASLTDEQFKSIQEGLSYTSLVASLRVLANRLPKIEGVSIKEILEIFKSVGSLIMNMNKEEEAAQFADDITNIGSNEGFVKDKSKFHDRLLFLISTKQIYYAAKGSQLN